MKNTIAIADKAKTRMIAYRGVSGLEQENTIPAFVAACNRSYFGIECDVHVTKDGKYIVYHDDNTGRLCNKTLRFEESLFAELRALKIKGKDSEAFDETLILPTLEEYLNVLSRYDKTAVIELKQPLQPNNIREIVDICKAHYSLDHIIFISFELEYLIELKKYVPGQKAQLLVESYSKEIQEQLSKYSLDIDIGFWFLSREIVAELHAHGITVNCWTCNERDQAEQLIDWGVDFITSNILE